MLMVTLRGAPAAIACCLATAAALLASPLHAQISLDGTLGRPTPVLTGPNYTIGANVGRLVGGNLFHSFGQFNVNTGQSATFSGPGSVTNIVGRVTGGSASNIDGTLRSTISGANLFLINPSGIMFGPNAALDVSGSFHASTAHYLALGSGGRFDAVTPAASVLKSAPPSAFGFLGPAPASITVNGSLLAVPTGTTLSLVGGDLALAGADLVARGGRVNLASVAAAGEVAFTAGGISATSPAPLGTISMSDSFVAARSAPGAPSAGIRIRAGRLTMDGSSLIASTTGAEDAGDIGIEVERLSLANGSGLIATTSAAGRGGDISIAASGSVTISGYNSFGNRSGLFTSSSGSGASGAVAIATPELNMASGMIATFGFGGSGNVDLQVGRLEMTAGARVDASTGGGNPGGSITVRATDSIALSGSDAAFNSGLVNGSAGTGDAGSITVSAPALTIDGGTLSSQAHADGRGGDIDVSVGRLVLTGGGRIDASTFGPGRAGNLSIAAAEAIEITGRNSGGLKSGLLSIGGAGAAGSISVTTPRLSMDDGLIASFTDGAGNAGNIGVQAGRIALSNNASLFASTSGTGNAGNIDVRADRLAMTGSAQILAITDGSGRAGNVSVAASESIKMTGPAPGVPLATVISSLSRDAGDAGNVNVSAPVITLFDAHINSEAGASGNAGDVTVTTGALSLFHGAQISSATFGSGAGKTVNVSATDSVTLSGRDEGGSRSGLFATAQGTTGGAGEINVSTPLLNVDGGVIASSTFSAGDAGDVNLNVGRLVVTAGGSIAAETGVFSTGASARINIVASESVRVSGQDEISPSSISTATSNHQTGGTVSVSAPLVRVDAGGIIESSSSGSGSAGTVLIRAGRLSIANGGQVSSSTQNGPGGQVRISASDSIDISGGAAGASSTGIFTIAELLARRAGSIEIDAPLVTIDRGAISSAGSGLFGSEAGSVSMQVGRLALSNGASIDTSASANIGIGGGGAGGSISITAGDIALDASRIRAENLGTGDAGSITIRASNELRLANGSSISTRAAQGDGGNITITARDLVYLRDSQITTSVGTGEGSGGNITIDPTFVVLDNSQIIANAFGGDGGNITIVSDFFLKSPDSLVQASSQGGGISGVITISAPNVDVSAGLAALPSGFFDASLLLRESCSARAGRASSSFTGVGRGGLPATPGQMGFGSYAAPTGSDAAGRDAGFTLASARLGACR